MDKDKDRKIQKTREALKPSRRGFIGAGVAALAAPALAASETEAAPASLLQTPPAATTAIDVPTLRAAQSVASVQQTDEALTKATSLVARYRTHIETLRGVEVATDVEPAFSFNPRRDRLAKPAAKPATAPKKSGSKPSAKAAPGSKTDIAFASVSDLRAWLLAGRVSSEELARLSIDRLAQHDAALSCVVTLADERVIEEAKLADTQRRKNEPASVLHGIPYGAKDLFDSASIRTLWGARPYLNRPVPKADATAIARLKAAGACLAAKLSTGELAIGDA